MRYVFKKVWTLIKPYRKQQLFVLFLTVLLSLTGAFTPLVSKIMIDNAEIITAANSRADVSGQVDEAVQADIDQAKNWIFTTLGVLAGIGLAGIAIGMLVSVINTRVTERITRNMRNTMFSKMLYSNFGFLNKVKGGDLISVIMNDGRSASDFISTVLISVVANAFQFIAYLACMMIMAWDLTLLAVGLYGLYFIFQILYTRRLQKMSLNVQETYDDMCTSIGQTNSAILSYKSYNQEKSAEKRFRNITDRMYKNVVKLDINQAVLGNLSSAVGTMCIVVLYFTGFLRFLDNQMTLGDISALIMYFTMLGAPVESLMSVTVNVNVYKPIFERIEGYTELEQEDLGTYEGILKFPEIKIRDLSFAYGSDDEENIVLKNVSLQLPARGLVNIIGESGSGKTTFTKLLLGLYPVPRGKIYFGNRDINDISIATLRGNIAYVPQESEILNDTVFNNISFGDKDVWLDEAMEVCSMLRLHSKIMSLPQNYNSVISERVDLSGGEKQRILIARGILKEVPIIIMDEPLSALDAENSDLVSRIIMRLAEEKLILMITHYECEVLKPTMKVIFDHGKVSVWHDPYLGMHRPYPEGQRQNSGIQRRRSGRLFWES